MTLLKRIQISPRQHLYSTRFLLSFQTTYCPNLTNHFRAFREFREKHYCAS